MEGMTKAMLAVALIACGPTNSGGTPGDDTGVDAHEGSGSGIGSGSGSSHVPVVDAVSCTNTHTVTQTQTAGGTRTVTDTKFALVSGIDPNSDFTLEQCDIVETETVNGVTTTIYSQGPRDVCSPGNTCTASGTPYPPYTHACGFSKGGNFVDDKLFVTCGTHTTSYDASNAIQYVIDYTTGAIRLHH